MNQAQVHALLYQALETELGGIHVYQTALQCTVNAELTQEWQKYLEQTETHAQVLRELFATLKLNPDQETPGRQVVRHLGHALVTAMEMALAAGNPEAAQLVAAECVVTAETKDHLNWELLSEVAEALKGNAGKAVQAAYQQVEDEEDEHLYHTTGWSRELWIASLGLPAVLPPPEEEKEVKTAIVALTRSLALALADQGIRVNGVAPGPIWPPLIPSTFDEDKVAHFGANVPLQRAGQPEEIAPSYVFLASDDASYMTGQVLHPNGGEVING